MGRIFDDLGNRMTPSHSNKRGVRYRYYVSHALIQGRKRQAGSVQRIPAVEIEDLVLRAVRMNLSSRDPENVPSDRQAIVAQIDKITAKRDAIEIQLLESGATSANSGSAKRKMKDSSGAGTSMISIPWTASTFVAVKGIVQAPQTDGPTLNPDKRDVLLNAIAKTRRWIDDITSGRVKSFADIATKEKNVERHIRLLAPLAFVAPSLVQSIIDGIARQPHGHRTGEIVRPLLAQAAPPSQDKRKTLIQVRVHKNIGVSRPPCHRDHGLLQTSSLSLA
jgi:site-specific DNA recombinase